MKDDNHELISCRAWTIPETAKGCDAGGCRSKFSTYKVVLKFTYGYNLLHLCADCFDDFQKYFCEKYGETNYMTLDVKDETA